MPASPATSPASSASAFHGDTVVRAAFVLAMFGWGVGFYGPPVFLQAVVARTGWSIPLVSTAVTFHFLFGAGVAVCLPRIHRYIGVPAATVGGAFALALGTIGWAVANHPWQLFATALLTGGGWVPMGAAGINAIISPWFTHKRPMALAKAYNGASVGGMVFSPLWVASMARYGFLATSAAIGLLMVTTTFVIASRVLTRTPVSKLRCTDGTKPACTGLSVEASGQATVARSNLWHNRAFLSLASAMALGLFAQIGLIAQLFSLMVPAMGPPLAAWTMALATACGMGGRLIAGRWLGPQTDRRRVAGASYALQVCGTLMLFIATPGDWPCIAAGVVLFGFGIGNATSLPPLIAQAEFAPADVPRVVARCVALSQALYAFAPAALSLLLTGGAHASPSFGAEANGFFVAVFVIQSLAIACMLAGRQSRR